MAKSPGKLIAMPPYLVSLVLALLVVHLLRPERVMADFQSESKAGTIALSEERLDEAEDHFQKALTHSKIRGFRYAEYSQTLVNLARVAEKRKQVSKAESYYKEALAHCRKALGENSQQCGNIYAALGDLNKQNKNFKAAIPYYESAFKIRNASTVNSELVDVAFALAECYIETGNRQASIPFLKTVIDNWKKTYGITSARLGRSCFELGLAYEELGKPDLAIPMFENAHKTFEATLGSSSPLTIRALEHSGFNYAQTEQLPKARLAYLKALDARAKMPQKNNQELAGSLKKFIEILKRMGLEQEARKLQARLNRLHRPNRSASTGE